MIVIGAGVAGILVGIRLLERGIRDSTVLEKADTLGGPERWRHFHGVPEQYGDMPTPDFADFDISPLAGARS